MKLSSLLIWLQVVIIAIGTSIDVDYYYWTNNPRYHETSTLVHVHALLGNGQQFSRLQPELRISIIPHVPRDIVSEREHVRSS